MGDHKKLITDVAPEVKVLRDQFQVTKRILHSFNRLASQNNPGGQYLSKKSGQGKREKGSQTVVESWHIDKQSLKIAKLEHQLRISERERKKLELESYNQNAEIWRLRKEVVQLKKARTSKVAVDSIGTGGRDNGRQEQRRNEKGSILESSSCSVKKGDGSSSSLSKVEDQGQGQRRKEGGSAAGDKTQGHKTIKGKNWNIPRTTIYSLKHNLIGCYPCKECGLNLDSLSDLKSHLSSAEHKMKAPTKEAKHNCEKCDRSFTVLADVIFHNVFSHRDNATKK